MSEWQLIEMAPKDGTLLKLRVPASSGSGHLETVGHYVSEYTEGWETEKGTPLNPTHWMPLPAPPHPSESEKVK